jgi:uncharacterized membrane protein
MRRRLLRDRRSYLLGIGILVIIVVYFTSSSRVSRENVTIKNAEGNDAEESAPDLNSYIVSNGIRIEIC